MLKSKQKIRLILSFSVLLSLALAAGCKGFFVNPTLTTITVTPATPTIATDSQLQMTATGTYDDGSIKTLTGNVGWTSSDITTVSITSGGLVKGVATGSSTITASSGIATGSTTVTVSPANLTSIQITPQSTSVKSGSSVNFTATGTISGGGTQNVTSSATWTANPNPSNGITFTLSTDGTQEVVTAQNITTSTTVTITASVVTTTGTVNGTAQLIVSP